MTGGCNGNIQKCNEVKEKNGGIHLDSKNSRELVMLSERTSHMIWKTNLCWPQKSRKEKDLEGSEQRRSLMVVE